MESDQKETVSRLLSDWARTDSPGDPAQVLLDLVRKDLLDDFRAYRVGHTLSIGLASVVRRVLGRYVDPSLLDFESRSRFLLTVSRALRAVLVDSAERVLATDSPMPSKRPSGSGADERLVLDRGSADEVVRFDRALSALESTDQPSVRVFECRFFGGMSIAETATAIEKTQDSVQSSEMAVVLAQWGAMTPGAKVVVPDRTIYGQLAGLVGLPVGERGSAVESVVRGDTKERERLNRLLSEYESAHAWIEKLRLGFALPSLSRIIDELDTEDPLGLVGSRVSHFRVEQYVGGGGMSLVYRALDLNLAHRSVVLKFLRPEISRSRTSLERFKREATAASSLDHANIATVYEVDETRTGQFFIAMAWYDGETLDHKIERGPLPVDQVVKYGLGICGGLAAAHTGGILHRDIKPSNIIVTERGDVRLLDFGVARITGQSSLTDSGETVGTAAHMAPEQARGEEITERSDIWAIGLVLYELLTGEHPFLGPYPLATAHRICNEEPEPLGAVRPEIPAELAAIVHRCLEKDPDGRPATCAEIAAQLQRVVDAKHGQSPDTAPGAQRSSSTAVTVRRARWAAMAVGLVLVILWMVVPKGSVSSRGPMYVAVLPPIVADDADTSITQNEVSELLLELTKIVQRLVPLSDDVSLLTPDWLQTRSITTASDAEERLGASHAIESRLRRAGTSGRHELELVLVDLVRNRRLGQRRLDLTDLDAAGWTKQLLIAVSELLGLEASAETISNLAAGGTSDRAAYRYYFDARDYLLRPEDPANVTAAIRLLELAVGLDSTFGNAHAALAEAYDWRYDQNRDSTDFHRSAEAGRRAVDVSGENPAALTALGRTMLFRGLTDIAELQYRRAKDIDPLYAEAHAGLAEVYMQQGDCDRAIGSLQQALELRNGSWLYRNRLGQFYMDCDRLDEAISAFRQVTQQYPDNPWGYNNVGATLLRMGQPDEAIEWYRMATTVNPRAVQAVAQARRNIAGVYYTHDEFDQAAEEYEAALKLDSLSIEAWDQMGNAYWRTHRTGLARRAWRRVVELAGDRLRLNQRNARLLEVLTFALAKSDERDAALDAASRLEEVAEQSVSSDRTLALVYERLGMREDALRYMRKALQVESLRSGIEASIWLDSLKADSRYGDMVAALD